MNEQKASMLRILQKVPGINTIDNMRRWSAPSRVTVVVMYCRAGGNHDEFVAGWLDTSGTLETTAQWIYGFLQEDAAGFLQSRNTHGFREYYCDMNTAGPRTWSF